MKSAETLKEDMRALFDEKRQALPQGLQRADWPTGVHLEILIEVFAEMLETECAAARNEAIEYTHGSGEE